MIKSAILPVLLVCSLFSRPCFADEDHKRARDLVISGEILSLDTILRKSPEYKDWKLLEAELEKEKGVYIYELEILDDHGKVREVKFDAKTGEQILREKK